MHAPCTLERSIVLEIDAIILFVNCIHCLERVNCERRLIGSLEIGN